MTWPLYESYFAGDVGIEFITADDGRNAAVVVVADKRVAFLREAPEDALLEACRRKFRRGRQPTRTATAERWPVDIKPMRRMLVEYNAVRQAVPARKRSHEKAAEWEQAEALLPPATRDTLRRKHGLIVGAFLSEIEEPHWPALTAYMQDVSGAVDAQDNGGGQ